MILRQCTERQHHLVVKRLSDTEVSPDAKDLMAIIYIESIRVIKNIRRYYSPLPHPWQDLFLSK